MDGRSVKPDDESQHLVLLLFLHFVWISNVERVFSSQNFDAAFYLLSFKALPEMALRRLA